MSVSVTIRTKNIVEPATILHRLSDAGEKIVVTSDEYPSVKFGNHSDAIRGIEVNKQDNGMEVRVCTCASKADYRLFAKTIDLLMSLTGGRAFIEDDDDEALTDVLATFTDDWMHEEQVASIDVVRALVRHSGEPVGMSGLIADFYMGAKFFLGLGISLTGDIQQEELEDAYDYLCIIQWYCASHADTHTRMMLPSPNGDDGRDLSLSLIAIKNGEVSKFDYVSHADVLCLMDMDNDDIEPAMVPIKEVWKILPGEVFESLDETQYFRREELTVDMVHEMMQRARHLQPHNLHYVPTYPGEGFDKQQNTIILMWNPAISSMTLDSHCQSIPNMLTDYFNWSVWEHDKARCGDRFFLVRVGQGNTGVVMSGVFDSNPYELDDWSGRGRRVFYMDMLPNTIFDPDKAPILTTEELQKAIPTFDWSGGHSGRILPQHDAKKLETMWQAFLEEHDADIDGVTMNAICNIG